MTATTKEQREKMHSLTDIDWLLDCPGDPIPNTVASDALRHLPALLSDSERLAAIEAVTGDEVKAMVGQCRFQARFETLDPEYERFMLSVADALLSLSAKVADLQRQIEKSNEDEHLRQSHMRQLQEERDGAIVDCEVLSAKVAEQAEEIERMRMLLAEIHVDAVVLPSRPIESVVPTFLIDQIGPALWSSSGAENKTANTIRVQMEGVTTPSNNGLSRQMDEAQAIVAAMPKSLRDGLREQMEGGNA